jgi:hypothetical protein
VVNDEPVKKAEPVEETPARLLAPEPRTRFVLARPPLPWLFLLMVVLFVAVFTALVVVGGKVDKGEASWPWEHRTRAR